MSITPAELLEQFQALVLADLQTGHGNHKVPRTDDGLRGMHQALVQACNRYVGPGYTLSVHPLTDEDKRLRKTPTITLKMPPMLRTITFEVPL